MSIPVTVLGGFLGAGKTTALNALLLRADRRIAVLVNDFGSVNIDAALIAARQAGMVALSNGCVCCALGPDLGEGIARLSVLHPPPEHIVIEASGVSDPWRIAQLVRLETGVHLDAVLVLADAQRFSALLSDRWLTDTLQRQVARADMVLLTHTDLASAAETAATRAAVLGLRHDVPVAAMPPEGLPLLLGIAHDAPRRFRAEAVSDHGFRQVSWSLPGPLDRAALLATLDALPDSVLRLKGFCRLGPEATLHLVQRAGRRVTLEPWPLPVAEARPLVAAKAGPLAAVPETFVLIGTPDMPPDVLSILRCNLKPASRDRTPPSFDQNHKAPTEEADPCA